MILSSPQDRLWQVRAGAIDGRAVVECGDCQEVGMATQFSETSGGKVLEIAVTGKLRHEDYEQFVPAFERLVKEHGKIRVLFHMLDFHGWEATALWDDVKFDVKHFSDIERLAMVGDKGWEAGMAAFCRPFTTATIRYFDQVQMDEARTWLTES